MDWLSSIVASPDCGAPPLSQDQAQPGCSCGANQAFVLRPSLSSRLLDRQALPDGGRRPVDQIRPGIQWSDLIHDLDTFTFKALKFYERLGYREFGRLDDFPPGHSRICLTKRF
jgi:hypothetical protein